MRRNTFCPNTYYYLSGNHQFYINLAVKRLIPHLFTAGNLLGGILAIIFALTGRMELAPYCIFVSAFLDFFDGFAARLLKVPSELGKQLDSLADMVTFGVAPGVIVYQLFNLQPDLNYFQELSESLIYETHNYIGEAVVSTKLIPESGVTSIAPDWLNYSAFLIPIFAMLEGR